MTWIDRLRDATYTSPSGRLISFQYEDVTQTIQKNNKTFEFPKQSGTYVQDLGRSGRKFPLKVFFSGPDCDIDANVFTNMVLEKGIGVLSHPMYGRFDVVPVGSIERDDRLKTAANQVIFRVTFWESGNSTFITDIAQRSPVAVVLEQATVFNQQSSEQFADRFDPDEQSVAEEVTFRDQVVAQVNAVRAGVRTVAEKTEAVRRRVQAVTDSIIGGINELVGTPLTLASQLLILGQTPILAADLISNKFDAYENLLNDILSRTINALDFGNEANNEFLNYDQSAQSLVSALAIAAVNTPVATQTEAIEVADALGSAMDAFTDWRDTQFTTLGVIDTGQAYQALQQLVEASQAALIILSFDLPSERVIYLSNPRNLVELVAELYGEVDTRLDQFIAENELTGDELLELPAGRKIVYHVD